MFHLRRTLSVLFIVFTITNLITALYYSSSSMAVLNGATAMAPTAEEEVQSIQEIEYTPTEEILRPEPRVLASVGFPRHLNLRAQLLNQDFTKPPSA